MNKFKQVIAEIIGDGKLFDEGRSESSKRNESSARPADEIPLGPIEDGDSQDDSRSDESQK
jgi:hypothetical protein